MQLLYGLALIAAASIPGWSAAVCDQKPIEGVYGFLLYGDTNISGETKPFTNLGRVTLDANKAISGTSSIMFSGLLLGNPVTGTYDLKTDCTLTFKLQDDSGALQNFTGTITPDRKTAQFRQADRTGNQHGTMELTTGNCSAQNLQKKYAFALSGKAISMTDGGGAPRTVSTQGLIAADMGGNFKLTKERLPVATDVGVSVDSDCVVQMVLTFPLNDGEPVAVTNLRGILVNNGQEILAIQTDPGSMVWAKFTAAH